ncbi:unnamed protein product [Gordionus sp. m RMFG-2023]
MVNKLSSKHVLAISLAVTTPILIGLIYYKYKKNKIQISKEDKKAETILDKDIEIVDKPPFEKAIDLKLEGNEYVKNGNYEAAINNYTEAIKLCPAIKTDDLATFYNNRAVAFFHEKNYEKTIEDSTKAFELKKSYPKALFRRAVAHEKLDHFSEGYIDITAVCFLEQFSNMETLQVADRILKKMAKEKAKEYTKTRNPELPAEKFIHSFIQSFNCDPVFNYNIQKTTFPNANDSMEENEHENIYHSLPNSPHSVNPIQNGMTFTDDTTPKINHNNILNDSSLQNLKDYQSGDNEAPGNKIKENNIELLKALELLHYQEYKVVIKNCKNYLAKQALTKSILKVFLKEFDEKLNTDIEPSLINEQDLLMALLLSTFYLLMGDKSAKSNFEFLLDLTNQVDHKFAANLLIKIASCTTQECDSEEALGFFDRAIKLDPNNCDIFYHRGQFQTLFGHYDKAKTDFEFAASHSTPNLSSILPSIQRDYTRFKIFLAESTGSDTEASAEFSSGVSLRNFPTGLSGLGPTLNKEQQTELAEKATKLIHDGIETTLKDCLINLMQNSTSLSANGFEFGPHCYNKEMLEMIKGQTDKGENFSEAHVFLAQAYSDIMNYDKAEMHLNLALETDPQNFSVLVHLALLNLQKLNLETSNASNQESQVKIAIEYIHKCLDIEPRCEFAYETLGTIYMQSGRFQDALANFEKAMLYVKSEFELAHLIAMRETVLAQKKALQLLGMSI